MGNGLLELVVVISFLAGAYQKLTEKIVEKLSGKMKAKVDAVVLCFLFSFLTCLFWRVGILNLYKETPIVFDAFITGLFMALEAGVLNDAVKIIRGKKEATQGALLK